MLHQQSALNRNDTKKERLGIRLVECKCAQEAFKVTSEDRSTVAQN